MNHVFNVHGVLIPKKPADPPRQKPPVHRDDPKPAAVPDAHAAVLRLTETLINKGILDGNDLFYILGGHVVLHRGQD